MSGELEKLTKEVQQECHEVVEGIMLHPDRKENFSHQDAANVFFYKKLAEFEIRLRRLEAASGRAESFLNMHTPLI